MSVLIIGAEEEQAIHRAVTRARAKPKPWALTKAIADGSPKALLLLGDRKVGADKVLEKYPSQNVMLGTYRAAISFEEQPAGLFKHLSVSSHAKGKVPGPEVMKMVCKAFGFSGLPPTRPGRVWAEEFEPGHIAINIIEIEP